MGRLREWSWDLFRGPALLSDPAHAVFEALAAERERWALWLPVCLGTGIAVYFALDSEPDMWFGPLGLAAAAVIGLAGRRQIAWMVLFVAVGTAALGFTLAQLRTAWVAAPVLEKRIGPVEVAGRLVAEERRVRGRRIVLDRLTVQRISPERVPARIRLTVHKMPIDARPGDRITVRAILSPPPAPAAPDAFDFSRRAYFQRLGAVGFAVSGVRLTERGPPDSASLAIQRMRHGVTTQILGALESPSGPVAAALMTGKGRDYN